MCVFYLLLLPPYQTNVLLGEDINEKAKNEKKHVILKAEKSPLRPPNCVKTKPQDRCCSNWPRVFFVGFFFTSNSDVTLRAFFKWFKYLHPLSAAAGMLSH